MDESSQQIIALVLVAAVVGIALWRKLRNNPKGKSGCSGCEPQTTIEKSATKPLKFYKRQQ